MHLTDSSTGYRMAKNLREKIPADDVLMIQDINKDAVKKFVDELSGFNVIASDSARAIAEQSVRLHNFCLTHSFQ